MLGDESGSGLDFEHDLAVDDEVRPVFPDLCLLIRDCDWDLPFIRNLPLGSFKGQGALIDGFQES